MSDSSFGAGRSYLVPLIGAAMLVIPGCSQVQLADPIASQRLTGTSTSVMNNAQSKFLSSYLASADATFGKAAADSTATAQAQQPSTVVAPAKKAANNGAAEVEDKQAVRMLDAGIVMIDLQCSQYLDDLGRANQRSNYNIQQTNLAGGLVAALMGVGGSAAKEISGVGSIFSFSAASQETQAINYLFADASTSIIRLVSRAKEKFKRETEEASPDWVKTATHVQVMQYLLGYEQLCRPAKIREMINQALSVADIAAEKPKDDGTQAAVAKAIAQIQRILGSTADDLAEGDAMSLYKEYLAGAKSTVNLTNGNTVAPAEIKKLESVFLPLKTANSQLAIRWNNAVTPVPKSSTGNQAPSALNGQGQAAPAASPISPQGLPATRMLNLPEIGIRQFLDR